jgi:cytochrome c oxidase subunit 2
MCPVCLTVLAVGLVALFLYLVGLPPQISNQENQAIQEKVIYTEIPVIAQQFSFVPNTIYVGKGENVKLVITSSDVTHGIAIPDLGVNQTLPVGTEVEVIFQASDPGTYWFYCSVPCGVGHTDMVGQIIVS